MGCIVCGITMSGTGLSDFYFTSCGFLLISSSVVGHLGCFYLYATGSNAAMNMGRQISIQVPDFSP